MPPVESERAQLLAEQAQISEQDRATVAHGEGLVVRAEGQTRDGKIDLWRERGHFLASRKSINQTIALEVLIRRRQVRKQPPGVSTGSASPHLNKPVTRSRTHRSFCGLDFLECRRAPGLPRRADEDHVPIGTPSGCGHN